MLGIAVPTKDALTFCFNATPSLHAAFDIVEKTMNVKRKFWSEETTTLAPSL